MWERFKNLFNFFPEKTDDRVEDRSTLDQTNDINMNIYREHDNNNQSNIHKQRSFRFPLIPDDGYDPQERGTTINERPRQKATETYEPTRQMDTYKRPTQEEERRQSFEPSRFASPIHGYEDRRRQERIEHVPTFMRRKQTGDSKIMNDDSVNHKCKQTATSKSRRGIDHKPEEHTVNRLGNQREEKKDSKKKIDKTYTKTEPQKETKITKNGETTKSPTESKRINTTEGQTNVKKSFPNNRINKEPKQREGNYESISRPDRLEKEFGKSTNIKDSVIKDQPQVTKNNAKQQTPPDHHLKNKQQTTGDKKIIVETTKGQTKSKPQDQSKEDQHPKEQLSDTLDKKQTNNKQKETRQQRRQRERQKKIKQRQFNKQRQRKRMRKNDPQPVPFNVMMTPSDQKKLQSNISDSRQLEKQANKKQNHHNIIRKNVNNKQALNNETEQQSAATTESTASPITKWEQQQENQSAAYPKQNSTVRQSNKHKRSNISETQEEKRHANTFHFPLHLLDDPIETSAEDKQWVEEQRDILEQTLHHFNVEATVVRASQGPTVTRFEVKPDIGVKVSRIRNLSDDLKMNMAAKDIRIEAPIPGKNTVGIEIPNLQSQMVSLQEIFETKPFKQNKDKLTIGLGLNVEGESVVTTISDMPHGLIAGATGSGKSVCINTILLSLLYRENYKDLKLLLIDPKMVELSPYNGIPHLVSQVITDVKAATAALKWAVAEMEDRYEKFVTESVRDIDRYNKKMASENRHDEKMPRIVIVIDELADLMMVSPQDVEDAICRIAQKARACGMHLLIATQRPSVDVITGLIKANIPTRIAFSVSSQVDSRTIIDTGGAERLLGRGDMLFFENGSGKGLRLQGAFVSDDEIERVTYHLRQIAEPNYLFEQEDLLKQVEMNEEDELFEEVIEFILEQDEASTSMIQRQFRIGYNRAARLMDSLEDKGIISGQQGSRPRNVLMDRNQLQDIINI